MSAAAAAKSSSRSCCCAVVGASNPHVRAYICVYVCVYTYVYTRRYCSNLVIFNRSSNIHIYILPYLACKSVTVVLESNFCFTIYIYIIFFPYKNDLFNISFPDDNAVRAAALVRYLAPYLPVTE